MDELNHSFGQLSTKAAVWKPSSTSTVASGGMVPPESDLKASAVKEFVPGRGWVTEALHKGKSGFTVFHLDTTYFLVPLFRATITHLTIHCLLFHTKLADASSSTDTSGGRRK